MTFSASPSIKITAIVLAAGTGNRFSSSIPKCYTEIDGIAVIAKAIQSLLAEPSICEVIPVINPEHQNNYIAASHTIKDSRLQPPIIGGSTRVASVQAALNFLSQRGLGGSSLPDMLLIHDAARPIVPLDMLRRVIGATRKYQAAVPVLPVIDATKNIEHSPDDAAMITSSLERGTLRRTQTPQGFHFDSIVAAHNALMTNNETHNRIDDDADVMTKYGLPVVAVPGDPITMKITMQGDIAQLTAMLTSNTESSKGNTQTTTKSMPNNYPEYRSASGYDVHRLITTETKNIILGGYSFHCGMALDGHSDADVVLHCYYRCDFRSSLRW